MRTLIATLMILAVAGAASAAITVTGGSHDLLPNTAGQTIDILISTDASDLTTGCNLNVQLGNAQGTPDITNVEMHLTGQIFAGEVDWTYADGGSAYPGIGMASMLVGDSANDPVASGTLATVTIDTTGLTTGTWTLTMMGTLNLDSSMIFSSGSPSVSFVDGSVTVIPEPATMLLLGLGAVAAVIRRR